jgi:hypothetical protein
MPVSISGTNGVVFPDNSLQTAAASPYTLKNKIINGDFRIDQRNAGASVSTADAEIFTVDRWAILENGSMVFSAQQSTTVPSGAGFVNSILITTATSASPSSSTRSQFAQYIEGFNVADLGWGTASAKTVTLSFWVRSSLTGTFGGALGNSGGARSYPFTYTISSANTWEQKTITIAGDTSGTWLTNNGRGINLYFDLGMGSALLGTAGSWAGADYRGATGDVKLSETSGATFYITGVQLEVGSTATPFERRLYNQELANCQRYYFKVGLVTDSALATGLSTSSSSTRVYMPFPVTMRTAPTLSQNALWATDGANYNAVVSSIGTVNVNNNSARIQFNTNAVMTDYRPVLIVPSSTSGYIDGTSEL